MLFKLMKLFETTGGRSAPIPVRWMALETLKFDICTLSSHCWSFGVLLWEMFTFGERPYAGLQNKEILAHIKVRTHADTLTWNARPAAYGALSQTSAIPCYTLYGTCQCVYPCRPVQAWAGNMLVTCWLIRLRSSAHPCASRPGTVWSTRRVVLVKCTA